MSIINFKKIISYNYVYLCMICFFFDCVICFIVYDRLGYYVLWLLIMILYLIVLELFIN